MKTKIRWFAVLIFLVLGSLSCQWLEKIALSINGKETKVSGSRALYTIDSKTILQALGRGDENIFTYVGEEYEEDNPETVFLPPVEWKQAEYMDVAQTFFTIVRDEIMSDWSVGEMNFSQTCEDAVLGPQAMYFHLYKVTQTDKEHESRFEMAFDIAAKEQRVKFLEWEMYPNLGAGPSIDLAEIKIPAEDVLRIAEDYAGKEARLSVDNVCRIDLEIIAGQQDNNWLVTYMGYHGDVLVGLIIDSKTGEIVK